MQQRFRSNRKLLVSCNQGAKCVVFCSWTDLFAYFHIVHHERLLLIQLIKIWKQPQCGTLSETARMLINMKNRASLYLIWRVFQLRSARLEKTTLVACVASQPWSLFSSSSSSSPPTPFPNIPLVRRSAVQPTAATSVKTHKTFRLWYTHKSPSSHVPKGKARTSEGRTGRVSTGNYRRW